MTNLRISSIWIIIMSVMGLFSCQKDTQMLNSEKGKIVLSVQIDPSVNNDFGRQMVLNTDNFKVIIYNKEGIEKLMFEKYSDIPDEFEIDTGYYYLTAESSNLSSAAFESPYFYGETEIFHISAKEVKSVNVNCELHNFLVSIVYSDNIINNCDSWMTSVYNDTDTLIFEQDETRAGYFKLSDITVRSKITYKKSDGSSDSITVSGFVKGPERKKHYVINIDAQINAYLSPITISVDESSEIVNLLFNKTSGHFIAQPGDDKGNDTVVSLITPDENYGISENLHLYAWTQGGILNVNRVLIDFVLEDFPQYAVIDSAFLSLYFNPTSKYDDLLGGLGHQGENSFVIERILSDWDENTATWNKMPITTDDWSLELPATDDPHQNYENVDVTSIIQQRISNPDENFGMMLKFKVEEPYKVTFFASSENPDADVRPKLEIYWSLP